MPRLSSEGWDFLYRYLCLKLFVMAKNNFRIDGEISSYTAWAVKQFLRDNKGKAVTVTMASYGGDVASAVRISHAFAEHGDVTLIHDSYNASAATWLFGAKNIKMYSDCMLYIHCSSKDYYYWQSMNAEELKALGVQQKEDIKQLENVDRIIARKYADRSNGKYTVDDMLNLMKAHPWITADQCLEYGFIDEIISEKMPSKPSNSMQAGFRNCAIPLPEGVAFQDERSFLQKLADLFTANSNFNNNITTVMNKKYVTVNSLVNVEGFEEKDGKVVLTTAQMQVIEDALVEKNGKIENHGNLETELADVKNLKQEAEGQLTSASNALDAISDDVKKETGIMNKIKKIKEVLDKIPAKSPATNPAGNDVDPFADCRKDPINNYLDE